MINKKQFSDEWGSAIAGGGFLQIPHDLIRNTAALGLSCNDAMVLYVIIGYGRGKNVAAATIAAHLGLSVGTVRKSLRLLDKMKYLHRHLQQGEATLFSWNGLRSAVEPYAKNRQTRRRNFAMGVYDSPSDPGGDLYTNKEGLNNEDKKEGPGYHSAKIMQEKLRRKKKA